MFFEAGGGQCRDGSWVESSRLRRFGSFVTAVSALGRPTAGAAFRQMLLDDVTYFETNRATREKPDRSRALAVIAPKR